MVYIIFLPNTAATEYYYLLYIYIYILVYYSLWIKTHHSESKNEKNINNTTDEKYTFVFNVHH